MDAILDALGGLLLRALPTFILVVLVHFYLKRVFYRPLEKVLRERYDATEGARKLAEASLERASQKASEYEEAIRAARSEIYREQDETRRQWRVEQSAAVEEARRNTEARIKDGKAQLAEEVARARLALEAESERLGAQIVESILRRRPS